MIACVFLLQDSSSGSSGAGPGAPVLVHVRDSGGVFSGLGPTELETLLVPDKLRQDTKEVTIEAVDEDLIIVRERSQSCGGPHHQHHLLLHHGPEHSVAPVVAPHGAGAGAGGPKGRGMSPCFYSLLLLFLQFILLTYIL